MSAMRFTYQAGLLSTLAACSLACGQESTKTTGKPGPPPLEIMLSRVPIWKDNCLELSFQRTNLSKFSVFLDATYPEGIKIYSSVSDATNTLGQNKGKEAWMLVYGWTDVASESVKLAPGARKRNTLCIAETFPVKETGKEILRQVRVQGKLRIVASYEIPTWRIIHHPQAKMSGSYMRMANDPSHWIFREVMLEIPIPCPNGISASDCLSAPPIFPGEHDIHTFELEPPPAIEIQQSTLPIFPINRPPPPRP